MTAKLKRVSVFLCIFGVFDVFGLAVLIQENCPRPFPHTDLY